MYISSQNFGNNNPNMLYNNPPNITNYPFYEYMHTNKQNFDKVNLKNTKALQEQRNKQDKYMTGLLWATILACGVAIYLGRNKLKKLFTNIKNKFHKKQDNIPSPNPEPPKRHRRKGFRKSVKKARAAVWNFITSPLRYVCKKFKSKRKKIKKH